MRLLLDTHVLLWVLSGRALDSKVEEMLNDTNNEIFVSTASLWEIQIKNSLKPNFMPFSAKSIYQVIVQSTDFIILPVNESHVFGLKDIVKQDIHRDPFDHLLISTAAREECVLLTHDKKIGKYQGVKALVF